MCTVHCTKYDYVVAATFMLMYSMSVVSAGCTVRFSCCVYSSK